MGRQEILNTVLTAAVFVLVFCAWSICVVLWIIQYLKRQGQLRRRLGAGGLDVHKSQALQLWRAEYELRRQAEHRPRQSLSARLEQLRAEAGWKASAPAVLLAVLLVTALAFAAVYALGYGAWLAVGVAGAVLVTFYVLKLTDFLHGFSCSDEKSL